MRNKIMDRIEQVGIELKSHDGHKNNYSFEFDGTKQVITYPKEADVQTQDSAYRFAHELGHHEQLQKRSSFVTSLFSYARSRRANSVPAFILILIEEADAWKRSFRICKEEGVETDRFWNVFAIDYTSYISGLLNTIARQLLFYWLLVSTFCTIFYFSAENTTTTTMIQALESILMLIIACYWAYRGTIAILSITSSADGLKKSVLGTKFGQSAIKKVDSKKEED